MLRRRRAAQINRQSVPYGVDKVEYLESSGTQWILPNVSTKDLSVEIDYTSLKITNDTGYQKTLGFWGNNQQYQIFESSHYSSAPNIIRGSVFGHVIDFGSRDNSLQMQSRTKYKFDAIKGDVSLNGVNYESNIDFSKGSENNKIGLFVVLQNGTGDIQYDNPANMRLHSFKSWKLKSLQSNLIPTLDKTGTPCMFDLVTRKNFYNAGTGEFSYSHLLPKDYIKVDYLESSKTQYINTNFYAEAPFVVKCVAEKRDSNNAYIMGSLSRINPTDTTEIQQHRILFGWQGTNVIIDTGFGWNITNCVATYINAILEVDELWNKNAVRLVINGNNVTFPTHDQRQPKENISPLFLFASSVNGKLGSESSVRIYSFEMNFQGLSKFNFIPCLDPTGTPCMFDTVSQKPFYNSGTGDFLYPSPTSAATYSMRRPQAEYAKMTDTGVRRLYHVPVDYEGSIDEYASENGFKLLNETECPNEEGKYYTFKWVETDTEITTEWYETEPPTDEFGQVIENNNEQQSTTFNLRRPAPIDNTVYENTAKWAKMTDTGVHKIYHTPIGYEGSIEDYAIENGYKKLNETESPNEEGKYYAFKWVETDDTLTTEWFEIDPPQEEFIQ